MEKIALNYIFGINKRNKQLFNKVWEVAEPIKHRLHDGNLILIPKGFKTDLSSSPKFLWSVIPPFGDFLFASIVHDFLYVKKYGVNELGHRQARAFADKEMRIISDKMNGNKFDNKVRYWGVRLFGGKIFRK